MTVIVVKTIEEAGGACPFQVKATTETGGSLYARYRWGVLTVEVDDVEVFEKDLGEDQDDDLAISKMRASGLQEETISSLASSWVEMRKVIGGKLCFSGFMSLAELVQHTKDVVQWPDSEVAKFLSGS